MRSKNLVAVILVGSAAVLMYMALAPSPSKEEDATARPRASLGTEVLDENGLPVARTRIEWASWRTPENEAEEPAPVRTETDPRLEELLDGLQNVDVYVEGLSNGR